MSDTLHSKPIVLNCSFRSEKYNPICAGLNHLLLLPSSPWSFLIMHAVKANRPMKNGQGLVYWK